MPRFHIEIEARNEAEPPRVIACEIEAPSETQAIKPAWTYWEAAYGEGERPALRRITVEGIPED